VTQGSACGCTLGYLSAAASRLAAMQQPEVLDRPLSAYSLYPLGAEGWYTPLAVAVVRGHLDVVRVLARHGADLAVRAPDGRSLLKLAREGGHEAIARFLEQQGVET
jgi:hypothetical protein